MSTATVNAVNLVEVAAAWRNARRLYPIYSALNQQFSLGLAPCRELDSPIDRSDPESLQRIHDWLEQLDSKVEVHQLRQLLQTTHIANEEGLRAMLARHLEKAEKTTAVRDKVDYLMVQYYAHCAPHDAHSVQIDHDHVAQVLEPVLGEVSPLVPDFCVELDKVLDELESCESLGDLLQKKVIDRARGMKDQAGEDYFKTSVLVAYARFNFLLRRGFFRLMHADLHAIRFAIHAMEARGQHSCDCTAAGMAADQSFAALREICHSWKQPFRAAYSVGNTFAQLVSVRAAVEAAAAKPLPAPDTETIQTSAPPTEVLQQTVAPATVSVPKESAIDVCISQIAQTLQSVQTKSASTCNFTLNKTKLVFASWEVSAFIQPSSPSAPVVRRAVASRVLLITGIEDLKRGEAVDIPALISQARMEAAQLQEQVAVAKEKKDIDTAVNLAATAKRLLALLEQAEKGK